MLVSPRSMAHVDRWHLNQIIVDSITSALEQIPISVTILADSSVLSYWTCTFRTCPLTWPHDIPSSAHSNQAG